MKKKKILIFSYYSNIAGACQAEWIDDKIDGLLQGGKEVALISSVSGNRSSLGIIHNRIPSISFFDFIDELKRANLAKNLFQFSILIFIPFVVTVGILVDIILLIGTKGIGEGRWSWIISATALGIYKAFRFKPDRILTSGGPASAHLAGIIVGKIFAVPVVVELQDPLSGEGIGRNKEAKSWLYKVERYIIKNAKTTVYVTKAAAEFAKNEFKLPNIKSIYPGAKDFGIKRSIDHHDCIKIIHLGSLYSTRNFDSIISAIDNLISEGLIDEHNIELINLGHLSEHERAKIKNKSYVKIMKPVVRRKALEFASKCDIALLLQHKDNRSNVTIPYKTYDYLNLKNRTLALLNSDELASLIVDHGHTAIDLDDVTNISKYLMEFSSHELNPVRGDTINYVTQANRLVDLG